MIRTSFAALRVRIPTPTPTPTPKPPHALRSQTTSRTMTEPLVPLADVERLSPRCIRILGGNPGKFTLQGTNTYLIGQGSRRILIDTGEGMAAWASCLKQTLSEEKASVETVLITHWHDDHVGGIQDLLSLFPQARIHKNCPSSGQSAIEDGQKFAVEGASLTALYTPGHTEDHMVFVFEEEDAMFTADNVLGQGTAVFENLAKYMTSLERMKHVFRGRAYPGHGPVIEDGPAKVTEYIRHRKEREEQVARTLRSIPEGEKTMIGWTPVELVKVIYQGLPEQLLLPASGNVLQILYKLQGEGKVFEEEGKWRWKEQPSL